jgi:zinc protease
VKRLGIAAALVIAGCGPKHAANTPEPGSGTGTGTGTAAKTVSPVDWAAAGIDWDHPPAPAPDVAYTPPTPETFELPNGIHVVLIPNHRLPLVSIRMVHTRAGAREDGAQAGLASLTADLLDQGAGKLDAIELPKALERLGAHLDTGVSEDATVVWLDTLASTLDGSLALLASVTLAPHFDKDDVERVRADVIEDLKQRPQEPRRVANLIFDQLVFGDHPYGRPVSGSIDSVAALDGDDVRAFWAKHYTPTNVTIVVAGDVDRPTLEKALKQRFRAWKARALHAAKPPALPAAATPTLAFVDRPGAPQSVVMIGARGPSAADPSYFANEVVNTAIGGSFAARLNHRIREELGYTYGIYSQFWRGAWVGSWSASTSLETKVTRAGIDEALAILADARTAELGADELARTEQLMMRGMPQDFETDAQVAGQFAGLVAAGRPLDWYQDWTAQVEQVTAAQARDAAAAAWANLTIVVVGDWKAVGPELEGLGLPIVHYDADGHVVSE